jgi:hypothetical protein
VTCVHPDIAAALESHRDAGMVIAFAKTGPGVFNEFGFRAPHGHLVTLLGAPTHDAPALSVAGSGRRSFLSLPAADIDLGLRFWTVLGARPGPTPPADWPCRRFEAGGLPLALHDPALLDRPALACPRIDRRRDAPDGTPVIPVGR